jgi:hypothetical protein
MRVTVPTLAAVAFLTASVTAPVLAGTPFPMPIQQGEVTYISGGIGDDEIAAMKASAGAYDLLVSNAEKDGSYTAGIDVVLRDGRGQVVLSAKNTGPLLYVKLAPGDYTLDANYHGVERVRDVAITPHRPAEIHLIWPEVDGS